MSGDLISRSELLKELSSRLTIVELLGVAEIVGDIPTVEAEPVVHAHWVIERWSSGYIKRCSCSNCGNHPRDAYDPPKYCDNCGAHMDEEVADE